MNAIERIAVKYFSEIKNYISKTVDSDEKLMRAIENQIDVPEQGADDFRRHILCKIGVAYLEKKAIKWDIDERLAEAFKAEISDRLIQIDRHDQVLEIMDKVNRVLKPYGLRFEQDENDESEESTAFNLI